MSIFRTNKGAKRGFTLIELLVVIAIIGILSSVVLASLNDARQKSRDAKRIADLKQLQLALQLYFDTNANYPTTLAALATTYIPAVPTDPVGGSAYKYAALGSGTTCSTYHLGVGLEGTTHQVLGTDSDGTAATACTGGGTDFAGSDTVGASSCGDAALAGRACYDLKP